MSGIQSYFTFQVAGLLLGIDVLNVQEVIRHRVPTRVPTAPAFVRGLINLRGQIVTVLDLRGRLGLVASGPPLERSMNVIVRVPGGPIGLIVDELGDVLEFDASTLERPSETIPEAIRGLITGLYPSLGRSLLVLDITKIVN